MQVLRGASGSGKTEAAKALIEHLLLSELVDAKVIDIGKVIEKKTKTQSDYSANKQEYVHVVTL